MRIMLTGANGQVGWELSRSLLPLGEVIALTQSKCDLSQPESLPDIVKHIKPDVIVNAAAYTTVDKAEEEEELATIINGTSVGVLAEEAKKHNALFVHYSTDYVFDGTKPEPYTEDDTPNPINAYGRSKLAGEEAVRKAGGKHLIFRTSWVYAARGNNFAKTILRLAREQDDLKVIADQYGAPTSAELIADITALVLYRLNIIPAMREIADTYHLTASGETSWYGFSKKLLKTAIKNDRSIKIKPEQVIAISTAEYPQAVQRPQNSRLDTRKLAKSFDLYLPSWQDHIQRSVLNHCGGSS